MYVGGWVSLVRECPLLVTDDPFLSLTWILGSQVAMEKGCCVSMETNPFEVLRVVLTLGTKQGGVWL